MQTRFDDIVDVSAIGRPDNPKKLNDILKLASMEQLRPAFENPKQVCLIAIDIQQDFMDNGALGVPGAIKDVERLNWWIYNNMDYLATIVVSIDTHNPFQIFHPCWWIDRNGNCPDPYSFTTITLDDLDRGNWRPVINPVGSREYVEGLKRASSLDLLVWPYHCLQGTTGHALENQFANMAYFHSVAKKTVLDRMVKGTDPMSEMYGIVKAEYDKLNRINVDFLNKIEKYDMIVMAGEAKSHCFLSSLRQIVEHFSNRLDITSKIYVLEDCMSSVAHPVIDFEAMACAELDKIKSQYKINIVKSTDLVLSAA
jgi:nicotinamidase-related amidase